MLFLKLGGSLITDKTGVEAARPALLAQLAGEIAQARAAQPSLRLLLGHGGGSFGHVAAAKYDTRRGARTAAEWRGFVEVHAAMLRLNRFVMDALQAAGVPALSFPPAALVGCEDGRITSSNASAIQSALDAGLVPVIHGDVAFDSARGGTIISTEEVMMALVEVLRPSWLLLAGETAGVLDLDGKVVPAITPETLPKVAAALGGSRGTDVTGGMASKVRGMLALVERDGALKIRIFSGLEAGAVRQAIGRPEEAAGTVISRNVV